jgi:hypothetical protein
MSTQGMDPELVRGTRESIQRQVDALTTIASDLSTTRTAAQSPQNWGIEPGEMTVAPASVPSITTARAHLVAAKAAAGTLLARLDGEITAQEEASANDFANLGGARPVIDSVRWWRNWISIPRSLFETPAALRMLWNQPALWRTVIQPGTWGLKNTVLAGSALKDFTRTTQTPGWVRSTYQAASNLKWQNYLDPKYMHSTGLHAKPPAWTNALHVNNPGFVSGAKTVAAGLGKGFGVLGVGVGVVNIASGISGMADGDVSSDDAWALADGIVGTVTSIGSFAPPPAGLVFAGVGAAYTAGRWLFGEDADGKTGIDKIGDFGKATGENIANGAKAVGDFVDDVWPW